MRNLCKYTVSRGGVVRICSYLRAGEQQNMFSYRSFAQVAGHMTLAIPHTRVVHGITGEYFRCAYMTGLCMIIVPMRPTVKLDYGNVGNYTISLGGHLHRLMLLKL